MADRYLRQTSSGHIYIWAPHFAERADMEEVVRTEAGKFVSAVEAPAIPEPKRRGRKPSVPVEDDAPPLFSE